MNFLERHCPAFFIGCIIGLFSMGFLMDRNIIRPQGNTIKTIVGAKYTKVHCEENKGCSFLAEDSLGERRWIWIPTLLRTDSNR